MTSYQLKNTSLQIKINSFGAELSSVLDLSNEMEYIWQGDKSIWGRQAPHLFPIVGRLKGNTFTYQSKSYELSQHGFARDSDFKCIKQTTNEIVFELKHSSDTLLKYPFQFTLQITYTLREKNLQVSYFVENPDMNDLYFSIGAHPAFNCPLMNNESFNDYELVFDSHSNLKINELQDGLITPIQKDLKIKANRITISKELFNHDALVFTNNQINGASLISKKTGHGVSLNCNNWPYYGIWTKANTSQFVCLEPWYGIADSDTTEGDITHKTGIIKLSAKQHFNCSFDIEFI